MARLFKKGKTALASSVLNILGLTAAFAALYIILVQVHHDLTYNKALKDSDRIYVLTQREINQSGYSSYLCRPMGEYVLNASPDIEAGGCGKIMGNPIAVRVSDDQSPVAISVAAMNQGARDVFGFELVAGNWEDLKGKGYALTESAAKRLGVEVGDVIKYHDVLFLSFTRGCFLALEKKETLSFATTWVDLEDVMLTEISQAEKDNDCIISLTCSI